MLSSLTTKIAMKKMGLSSDSFNFNPFAGPAEPIEPKKPTPAKSSKDGSVPGLDDMNEEEKTSNWPAWMTVKALPLTVQPWLAPPPPPIPVAECPKVGDLAPLDRDRKLVFGGGKNVLVVFLRCVGCACVFPNPRASPFRSCCHATNFSLLAVAQKTFLNLRTVANKHANELTCVAVSHSSEQATKKWLDMLGGAWNVQIVIDEDRSIYAAWGLGLGSVWYVLNPTTQVQSWKETGWLGEKVAGAIKRTATGGRAATYTTGGSGVIDVEGPATVMGNKWQTAGAWAVNGRGTVIWGGKALRADDVLDLEGGLAALGL
jgi:hypothetical protein